MAMLVVTRGYHIPSCLDRKWGLGTQPRQKSPRAWHKTRIRFRSFSYNAGSLGGLGCHPFHVQTPGLVTLLPRVIGPTSLKSIGKNGKNQREPSCYGQVLALIAGGPFPSCASQRQSPPVSDKPMWTVSNRQLPSGTLTLTLADKGWKTSFHYNLVVFRVYVYLPEGITYLNSWVTTWWKIFSTPNLNRHYSLVQVAKRLNAMSTTQWATNIYKNIGRTPGNHVDVLNDSPMVGEPHLDSSGYIWYPLVI